MASLSIAMPAPRSLSGATTASTIPTFNAAAALYSFPVVIHSSALSLPITRGRRTVPPKPGIIPSFTSGKPMRAVVSATRISVAKMVSQPPPRAKPLIQLTVGTGRSSNLLKMALASSSQLNSWASGAANRVRNSVMSAPTIKACLPEVSTTPVRRSFSACRALMASLNALRVRWSNLFTAPVASSLSSAIPSST